MTRLMLDHFRRWWWVLALAAGFTLCLGYYICFLGGKNFMFWVLLASMWMGATLLSYDLKHSLVRTVLALPLTAKQIGRGWWWATVGIPAVAMAALLSSGAAVWSHFHPGKIAPVLALAAAGLFCLLWLGNSFTSIYGMTDEIFGKWRDRLSGTCLALFSMIMLFGSMLLSQQLLEKPAIFVLFFGMGMVVTVASWLRAERFVVGRASFRLPSIKTMGRQDFRPPVGYGGFPLLISTTFFRGFSYVVAMVALMTVLTRWQDSKMAAVMLPQMGSLMSFFFIALYQLVPALRQLRVWRTLPVSATRLAAIVIGIGILPLLAIGGLSVLFAAMAWGKAVAITTLKDYAFVLVPASLSVFLVVWLGTGKRTYILLFSIIMGYGMSKPLVEARLVLVHIPFRLSCTLAGLCVLLFFLLTRRALLNGIPRSSCDGSLFALIKGLHAK